MVKNLKRVLGGKCLIVVLVFFFIFSLAYVSEREASAKINYTVIVKVKGEIKKDVSIELSGGNLSTPLTKTTPASGIVKFLKLAKGTYTVTPTKVGYSFNPSSKDITFKKKRTVIVSFSLLATEESITMSK